MKAQCTYFSQSPKPLSQSPKTLALSLTKSLPPSWTIELSVSAPTASLAIQSRNLLASTISAQKAIPDPMWILCEAKQVVENLKKFYVKAQRTCFLPFPNPLTLSLMKSLSPPQTIKYSASISTESLTL